MQRLSNGTMIGTPAEMIEFEKLQKGEKPRFSTPLDRLGDSLKIIEEHNRKIRENKSTFANTPKRQAHDYDSRYTGYGTE